MFKKKKEPNIPSLENGEGILSVLYWRKKYNTILGELELLKEIMRSDIYEKTIKQVNQPLELARYKRENNRLRNQLKVIRDERYELIAENRKLRKEKEQQLDDHKG